MFRPTAFILLILFSFSVKAQDQLPYYKDSFAINPSATYATKLGYLYYKSNIYDSAIKFLKLSNELMAKTEVRAYNFNTLGLLFDKRSLRDSALHYYTQAESTYLQAGDTTNAVYARLNRAIVYKEIGDYETSLSMIFNVVESLSEDQNLRALSSAYNTLATIYSNQNDFQNAHEYYHQSLRIRKKMDNEKLIAASLNNLGLLFQKNYRLDSAKCYLHHSLKIRNKIGDRKGEAISSNNLALIFLELNQTDSAQYYLTLSEEIKKDLSDKEGLAISYNNMGLLYQKLGKPSMALAYLNRASPVLIQLSMFEELKDNLELKTEIFEELKMLDSALLSAKLLMNVKDTLLTREKIKSISEMQIKFESEKKQQQIALLEQDQLLQHATIQNNKLWIYSLIGACACLLLLGYMALSKWRSEERHRNKIEILMQELHHRVKNNLQILSSLFSLQTSYITDDKALETVKSGENRINAMAIIHQKLYTESAARTINLRDYINNLSAELASSFAINFSRINVQVPILYIDVDQAIPLGLVINEVISNSMKHALSQYPKASISINVTTENKELNLIIKDSGPGYNSTTIINEGMGLNLISTFSRQLKAKTNWCTTDGVTFTLSMKLKDIN